MRRSPALDRRTRHVPEDQIDRGRANLRARQQQIEFEHQQAIWKGQEMANREKSPTGILRAQLDVEGARAALGMLHRKLEEAADEVREAVQREAQMTELKRTLTSEDAQRAPAMARRKAVS